ncbi:MAG: hypothetical protein A3F68_10640 [Acidobacteria bacterium RIFCSPLOWO2_12_FULL_54_10]|nr:MAG: hypothetical protein A3F68_10640 [Acidobacteria bacterium RIFCSPLOWO2_12_FULL_54_10]
MRDWLSDKRYLALLVLIALLILAVGNWLRPRQQVAEFAISEAERLRLQFLAQQRSLRDFTSYFERVAGSLGVHLVRLIEPNTSGLVWQGNRVLVPGLPRNHSSIFTLRSERFEQQASPSLVVPGLPISILESRSSQGFQAVRGDDTSALKPGAWVLLMTRQEDGSTGYSPGFFSSVSTATCGDNYVKEIATSLPLDASMLGGGLFDLEGHFLGMVLQCGPRLVAISVNSIYFWLQLASRSSERLLQDYGIRLLSLNARSSAHFQQTEGALISEVWKGSPAEMVGLVPGDIIISWDAVPVQKPDNVYTLQPKSPGEVLNIEIIRGQRVLKLTLEAISGGWWSRASSTAALGLQLELPEAGYLIESTEPGSPAQSVGLQAGDRVVMIDGRTVSRQQASLALNTAIIEEPIYVVVSRDEKTIGVLLP